MTGLTALLLLFSGALPLQRVVLKEGIRYSIEASIITRIPADAAAEYGGVSTRFFTTDSRGRVYHANSYNTGNLLVFDPSGRFLTLAGRPGSGPAEFGMVWDVLVGKGDTLHVIDATARRRTILGPDYKPIRTDALPGTFYRAGLLSNGRLVLSGRLGTRGGIDRPLHIFDPATGSIRSFGEMKDQNGGKLEIIRHIAVGKGDVFWTTVANSYLLQQWNAEGRLLKEFTRSVNWFQPGNRQVPTDPKTPPAPHVTGAALDASGLLWVSITLPNGEWRNGLRSYYDPNRKQQIYRPSFSAWDTIVEVVDPQTATVVASKRFQGLNLSFASRDQIVFYAADDLDRGSVSVWRLGLSNHKEEAR